MEIFMGKPRKRQKKKCSKKNKKRKVEYKFGLPHEK